MLQNISHIHIEVSHDLGLDIYPQSENAQLFEETVPAIGQPRFQLVEGAKYEYEFSAGAQFKKNEIVSHSRGKHKSMGVLTTGIYVGTLHLDIFAIDANGALLLDEKIGHVPLEIRSVKTSYEDDYRMMLSDIADAYTDLVLQQGSPVTQRLEVDDNTEPQTLYQRFCFVRGIIESETFQDAMHKIMSAPVRKWADATTRRSIVNTRRLSRKNIRDVASASDRIPLPEALRKAFPQGLTTVPRMIESESHIDSIDNGANQFVKFALRTFEMFCSDLYEKKNATARLKDEVSVTKEKINEYLDSQFFRLVSSPSHLNLNSPVLQRKEGYREVFQKWLLFDLAAKLNWTGGEDVYEAGKKNVATLYEYWLFLKLKDLISEYFHISPEDEKNLVTDADGIDLNLKQGRMTVVKGRSDSSIRKLNVAFYYNRTFRNNGGGDTSDIGKAGSWTMEMRPDYTLSIWPGEIKEEEAEEMDLITHVHFDAKYRLTHIPGIDKTEEVLEDALKTEAEEQELGIYKRADLLKMHAYKDAIRRTSGAYVLYPGDMKHTIRGFHEILPGLGAFPVRPNNWEEDARALKKFISDVKAHLLDRTSEREKMSYHQWDVYREANSTTVRERLPEPVGKNRDFMPDKIPVIVAYCKSEAHLQWILSKKMYNMRAGNRGGSMSLSPKVVNAKYLLLHTDTQCLKLTKLNGEGPKVYTRADLRGKKYPSKLIEGTNVEDKAWEEKHVAEIYLVYGLSDSIEQELQDYTWPAGLFKNKKPHAKMLSELIKLASKKK